MNLPEIVYGVRVQRWSGLCTMYEAPIECPTLEWYYEFARNCVRCTGLDRNLKVYDVRCTMYDVRLGWRRTAYTLYIVHLPAREPAIRLKANHQGSNLTLN